jgi:hypothetical protein
MKVTLQPSRFSLRLGTLLILFVAAAGLLPVAAGAQTPGTLVPMAAGANGHGSVALAGGNTINVTLDGVTPGSVFDVFACVAAVSVPTPPVCFIGNAQLVANAGGEAAGSVHVAVTDMAITQVMVRNVTNPAEMYLDTVVATAGAFGGSYVAPTSGGSAAPASSGGSPMPASSAPMPAASGGSAGGPAYIVMN